MEALWILLMGPWNPGSTHQLRLVNWSHYLQGFSTIQTVVGKGISAINSITMCYCTGLIWYDSYMGVSKDNGIPKSFLLTWFSIINHPFWGTFIFGLTPICCWFDVLVCFSCCRDSRDSLIRWTCRIAGLKEQHASMGWQRWKSGLSNSNYFFPSTM